MPESEQVLEVVGEWAAKAENDLKNAAHTLKLGSDCPTDTVCFHSQQCVEKYLKALLVLKNIDFPKTHDLEQLMSLLPPGIQPELSPEEQSILTEYATIARYPGWGDIDLREARRAVAIARRARKSIRAIIRVEAKGASQKPPGKSRKKS